MADNNMDNRKSLNGSKPQGSPIIYEDMHFSVDRSPSGRNTFQIEIIREDQKCLSIPTEELTDSCRLCVRRKGTITISERAKPSSERSFTDLLASLYLLEVEKNDRLPQKICKTCATLVNEFYSFKDQINDAQIILNVALGKVEVSNDSSTKTTDEMTDLLCKEEFDILDSDHVNEIEIETSDNANDNCQIESTGIIDDVKVEIECPNSDELKKYTCHFCGRIFSDRKEFLNHKAWEYTRKRNNTRIPCSICQKSIVKCRMRDHMNSHTKTKPHMCEICGKSYLSAANLHDHKMKHKETEPQICQLCGRVFKLASKLKLHLGWHKKETNYVCHICGRTSHSYSAFMHHHSLHRLGKDFSQDGTLRKTKKNHRCEICQKDNRSAKHLEVHMRSHTGERPFECTECGKKFIHGSHLSDHMKLHTGVKAFECLHCGKRFVLNGNLQQHIRIHTRDKRYCCDICQKSFYSTSSLKKHKMIHDKEKDTHKK